MYEKDINLPKVLKVFRKLNGYSIKDAAKTINVTKETWSSQESGHEISRVNYYKLESLGIMR